MFHFSGCYVQPSEAFWLPYLLRRHDRELFVRDHTFVSVFVHENKTRSVLRGYQALIKVHISSKCPISRGSSKVFDGTGRLMDGNAVREVKCNREIIFNPFIGRFANLQIELWPRMLSTSDFVSEMEIYKVILTMLRKWGCPHS